MFNSRGIDHANQERGRQISELGYDKEHDLHHPPQILIQAGMAYIEYTWAELAGVDIDNPPFMFQDIGWEWKPEDNSFNNLAKGIALVAAGYDRLWEELS